MLKLDTVHHTSKGGEKALLRNSNYKSYKIYHWLMTHLINREREKMAYVHAEMVLLIYLKHLSYLWKLKSQRLYSACKVQFNIVYNWMRVVLN